MKNKKSISHESKRARARGGEKMKMNVKIALLALLVILAATTLFATITAAFNEAPSITSIRTNADEEISDYLTLCNYTQPEGKDKGGGWP